MKKIGLVVSGLTDRAAMHELFTRALGLGVELDFRTAAHGKVTPEEAQRKALSLWWDHTAGDPLSKIVILPDADTKDPIAVEKYFRERLESLKIPCHIFVAPVKWHLEAWFFGDEQALRTYLGRDLGSCDPSNPDAIPHPKDHLKNLILPRVYTYEVAEEIASRLDPAYISGKSKSFENALSALKNGTKSLSG